MSYKINKEEKKVPKYYSEVEKSIKEYENFEKNYRSAIDNTDKYNGTFNSEKFLEELSKEGKQVLPLDEVISKIKEIKDML